MLPNVFFWQVIPPQPQPEEAKEGVSQAALVKPMDLIGYYSTPLSRQQETWDSLLVSLQKLERLVHGEAPSSGWQPGSINSKFGLALLQRLEVPLLTLVGDEV